MKSEYIATQHPVTHQKSTDVQASLQSGTENNDNTKIVAKAPATEEYILRSKS